MYKKLGFISLFLLIIVAISFTFVVDKNIPNDSQPPDSEKLEEPPVSRDESPESNQNNTINEEVIIKEVIELALKGKVQHTPFIAGETERNVVLNKWGEPKQSTKTTQGTYESYDNQKVTIGYHDDLIFDLRAYHSELSEIHLNAIKKVMGEPDDIRYYKDDKYDQIILIYQVNAKFTLKWILPNPNEQTSNPVVHHISLVTEVENTDETTESVQAIIANMSLEEKIGQMIFAGISGETLKQNTRDLITNYYVGGIILYADNLITPVQTVSLLNQMKELNKQNDMPLFLGTDQEGGKVTRLPGDLKNLPTNKEIGERNNEKFSMKIGKLLGKELSAFGFNLDFAPVLDVNNNPNNPIIGDRSFGSDAETVSKLGIQTMKGIQSQNTIAVIKHFPGHGDTSVDSHLELPIVNKSLQELKELELVPFKNAIQNGADIVMVAHILLPKLDQVYPSSMSEYVMNDLLRNQLHFNGVVITDDMTMEAITDNYDIGKAAVQSVKAGSDIILVAHDYEKIVAVIKALNTAVKNGEISEERLNESITRIIELKRKYNINNQYAQKVNIKELNQLIDKVLKNKR